jgi:superfamily II DNA helicase RecQ
LNDRVIISTSAFGLGMSYSDIRWVYLWEPPYQLLDYAQFIGRTARQQASGFALAFWNSEDFRTLRILSKTQESRIEINHLEEYYGLNSHQERVQYLKAYFV